MKCTKRRRNDSAARGEAVRAHAKTHSWSEGKYQYSFCQFYQACAPRGPMKLAPPGEPVIT